ncbi:MULTISPECIES: hypothetical protein [Saccharothrix]|uniref:hypothetical protein n=1 Tax=Saccharothrix TaxID=2071 RepID=UPI00093C9036|nr:hypothetical protein [Saccharothrix sp. CB00851]OKI21118.1 hypothetical protein A6A25_36970 [Saccharothrix sp. CB00851]
MREHVERRSTHEPSEAKRRTGDRGLLGLQRQAGNRAVSRLALSVQRVDRTLNPATASESEIAAEVTRVRNDLARMEPSDPARQEREGYLRALEARATQLGGNTHTGGSAAAINTALDSHTRISMYVDEARRISQQVLDDLDAGRVSHEEARLAASTLRNQSLGNARQRLTPGGRAMSEAIKEEGKTLDQLVAMYSERVVRANRSRYGLSEEDLRNPARVRQAARAAESSEEVSRAIISSAGRTNRAMTVAARVGRVAGPLAVGASLASSGYEIYHAQPGYDRARVITREAGGFAGGWIAGSAGSLGAAWAASLVCGPGMAVCALAISLVVVGLSAYGGGRAGEWVSEEAFTSVTQAPVPAATLWGTGGGYGGLMRRDFERAFGPAIRAQQGGSSGGER